MRVCYHWLLLLLHWHKCVTGALRAISPYIKHYEGLSYDREDLHKRHLRARRSTPPQDTFLHLDFVAFQRPFRLRLRRDAAIFSQDFTVINKNGSTLADLSHLYSGILEGEDDSSCHGSVIQGQFEGTIHTSNGTYHVESIERYHNTKDHHSVIYHEDDLVLLSKRSEHSSFCAAEHMKLLGLGLSPSEEAAMSRFRRTVDETKTSCLLHFHADHLYFNRFKSVEVVVAQIGSYIRAVNDIYDKVDFNGIKLINFKVKSLRVMTEEDAKNPLQRLYIGPEKLLSIYSENNWGNYCLSYLLTNRDYSGVLGLAWEGKNGNWGGICSQYMQLRNGQYSSLNTGLVTIQNYGQHVPLRQVQLTLAHELGHSLGAPHDEGSNCGNLGSSGGKGRFLMFPHASDEVRENNDKFSPCSIKRISKVLNLKKDNCFVVSDQPICGNLLVEEGEECDVGHNDTDPCCYSAKERLGLQCRLKPDKLCSPSQGLCCRSDCSFKLSGHVCDEETDCQKETVCSGLSAHCPEPSPKENLTICSQGTRVCLNGVCTESVCIRHQLQQCDCPGDSMKEKCHMCCQQPGQPETCASTTSSVLSRHFQRKVLPLVGGAPCSGNQGYCDKFHVCQLLDADGPIARLKNSFLHLDDFDDLGEWMKVYWWAILLTVAVVSAVMGCIVCLCSRTLDTSILR
ncbi:disintegrin and metalloproteinase domain-containing protein 10 [Periophthalmus magnuspinnatus]|uniref:disintegrin and metalloproteinase domain-containing protein 10 n=1 Tax=Periophthalmus magnuspinnatus TaxID=409849 RepID=UPI0024363640|nr:disintegrin and metalloproteinase domain-containing protein 10 [Periophthalmus magnuspinnatus]